MGLFKKRADDPDEITRLRAEVAAMGARLEAAEATETELGNQVADVSTRLAQVADRPEPDAPPQVKQVDHDMLNARVQRLAQQLEAAIEAGEEAAADEETVAAEEVDALRERVEALTARLDTPMETPAPPPPPTVAPVDSPVDLSRVEERIDELVARIDEVEARVTSISGELANQISEISDDLEARGSATPPADEIVGELRDAQTRLANEQARYQIAFRQDLADLAERLRRA